MFHNKASSIVEMGKADSINKILKLFRDKILVIFGKLKFEVE